MTHSTPATRPLTLEVCIDSVEGAIAAEQGGADRVELCANLLEGGTTPSAGMIRCVLQATCLPVMVMIRPRGGHFCFTAQEHGVMRAEAEMVLNQPVGGIVIGALTDAGEIDQPNCRALIHLAAGRSVTFHRAFDQVADPHRGLETLVDLGVDRVLTSGQAPSAEAGLARLRELAAAASGRLSIMPGCGVRATNVSLILQRTGAHEIHFSAGRTIARPVSFWRPEVPMTAATTLGDLDRRVTSLAEVQAICRAARGDQAERERDPLDS